MPPESPYVPAGDHPPHYPSPGRPPPTSPSAASPLRPAHLVAPSVLDLGLNAPAQKIKCVFLGDGAVGKTSLIVSYTINGYPNEYVPTAIDTYDATVTVDDRPVKLEICDTPGQDDFNSLRPLAYPHTDVFLLCFSVVEPSSFLNIREKWVPELKRTHPKGRMPPVILIGTQSDLRGDAQATAQLARQAEVPVTEAEARKLAAQVGCVCYIESSALTQSNLKEVFDEAILVGLQTQRQREERERRKQRRKKRTHCRGWLCALM
ncbi:cell division control protein 42 homolog [Tigriopus californicus]|uniref:cell division control protein 42 homolog n=1 Tax=Tigriopus californicus TaxID=6832 RepID=UPI0027DA0457|nr:cell division control protein 42 homolog [Tigriopus californicus]